MKESITWKEKYRIALQEEVTIKEIMKLRSIGQNRAVIVRNKVVEYCIRNNIEICSKRVPTAIVLMITDHDISYYYDKMKLEAEIDRYNTRGNEYVSA